MANHYQILDIDQDADQAAVKAAYRKLSKRYHPDITGDTKGHFFVMLNDAYETLSNESRRADYDRSLSGSSHTENPAGSRQNRPQQEKQTRTPGEIPYPLVGWNSMKWFTQDFSEVKERITLTHPGRIKGMVGLAGYLVAMIFLGLASIMYPFPGIPIGFISPVLAVVSVVTLKRYLDYRLTQWPYLGASAAFTGSFLYSMIAGGQSGNPVMFSIIIALACTGAGYLGLWSASRWRYWEQVRASRGKIYFDAADIKKFVSWGRAGKLDDAVDKFGSHNVALGSTGEKFTAEMMQQLLKIPGTRIFHGLKFPGSETADVDHALINGNKIALIDSKMWTGGDYRWGHDGMILRSNASTSAELHTNFPYAVEGYGRDLIEASVRGRILIHSSNGIPVSVDNSNVPDSAVAGVPPVEIVTAQQFFEEIGDWFAESPGTINRGLMNSLLLRMK